MVANNPKRILIVTHAIDVGGVGRSLINLVKALLSRGHSITIVSTSKRCTLASELPPEVNVKIKDEPRHLLLSKLPKVKYYFESGHWTTKKSPEEVYKYFVGKEKYDVEIAFFYGRPVKVLFGSGNPDSIKIMWVHSDFKKCSGYYGGFVDRAQAIIAYENFTYTICVSQQANKSFCEIFPTVKNVKTIYNLQNIDEITRKAAMPLETEKKGFTILFVGRLSEEKGCIRLLEACRRLKNERYVFSVWIVGDGPEKDKLERYCDTSGMTQAKFFGASNNPYKYMANCDLFVCTSYFEGYNNAVAEAVILQVPVLSTNCTGPYEILDGGKYGYIVDNDDEAIYHGLQKMMSSTELMDKYKKVVKERLPFFDSERIVDEIEELFSGEDIK